ncbi:MAG: lipocalin-like domain-containing protein [Bacteroidaceae bacterium]|nr:lipocalin-like domain-containing protein [Bacteroidaceae bacterium]
MKHLIYIALTVVALALASCMQNGGNIGYLYGQWRLEQVEHENVATECDTVFFSFQSNVFQIRKIIYDSYDYSVFMGLYEHQNDHIKFNIYNYNSQEILTPEYEHVVLNDLASLHIDTVVPLFKVVELNNKYMTLEYNDYLYYFKKLN